MGKNTIIALLTDLRALILKSRPAYRDYLGEVTKTKTTKILENVVLAENQLMLSAADAAFSGFISGEAYRVVLNGEEESIIAKDSDEGVILSNVEDISNLPSDYWAIVRLAEQGAMLAFTTGTFLGATISVYYDETVTEQRWSVKKLAYELLPDRLLSALSAAANTARNALTAANAAQSTANAAQSTADNALSCGTGGTVRASVEFLAGIVSQDLEIPVPDSDSLSRGIRYRDEASGDIAQIFFSRNSNTKTSTINIGNTGYGSGEYKKASISLNLGSGRGIFFSHDGEVYHMRCNGPLDFSANPYGDSWTPILLQGISGIIMHSSTSGSTKKFKITVDDTGTLSATEVTDTTT